MIIGVVGGGSGGGSGAVLVVSPKL